MTYQFIYFELINRHYRFSQANVLISSPLHRPPPPPQKYMQSFHYALFHDRIQKVSLYVLVMSRTRFRVNPRSIVA